MRRGCSRRVFAVVLLASLAHGVAADGLARRAINPPSNDLSTSTPLSTTGTVSHTTRPGSGPGPRPPPDDSTPTPTPTPTPTSRTTTRTTTRSTISTPKPPPPGPTDPYLPGDSLSSSQGYQSNDISGNPWLTMSLSGSHTPADINPPPPVHTSSDPPDNRSAPPPGPTEPLASNSERSNILQNKTASALIFTFTALLAAVIVGLLVYCFLWRRRGQQHVMLDDGYPEEGVGIRRGNSTSSSSRGRTAHRLSAQSGSSSAYEQPHYLPARFAGIAPIRRSAFDAPHIDQDPFSVHKVVYPDMPGSVSGHGHGEDPQMQQLQAGSPHFMLYPDPVPPPAPLRIPPAPARSSPPPAPPPLRIPPGLPPTIAEQPSPRPSLGQLKRIKPPSLTPPLPGDDQETLVGVGAGRPPSPESHYDEDSVYSGLQRAPRPYPYLVDRRPDKRRSQ